MAYYASIDDIISDRRNNFISTDQFDGKFTDATSVEIGILRDHLIHHGDLHTLGASRMISEAGKVSLPFVFHCGPTSEVVITTQRFPMNLNGIVRVGNEICFYA